jgi:prefoldin subunit 5
LFFPDFKFDESKISVGKDVSPADLVKFIQGNLNNPQKVVDYLYSKINVDIGESNKIKKNELSIDDKIKEIKKDLNSIKNREKNYMRNVKQMQKEISSVQNSNQKRKRRMETALEKLIISSKKKKPIKKQKIQ